MNNEDFISAAIVTYNDSEKAVNACKAILECTKKYPLKLYIADNASTDNTVALLEKIDGVTILKQSENLGFGAAHNKVLNKKIGKYHFVINPDINIESDVLSDMVDFMEDKPDICMVMPQILNSDGTVQNLPKEKPNFKYLFMGRLSKFGGAFKNIRDEYTWADRSITDIADIKFCSGCFFCIRGECFKKLGGFDERYFMYMEDADLTLSALKLGRVVINPHISVYHLWQRESAKKIKYLLIHIKSSFKFLRKWRKFKE